MAGAPPAPRAHSQACGRGGGGALLASRIKLAPRIRQYPVEELVRVIVLDCCRCLHLLFVFVIISNIYSDFLSIYCFVWDMRAGIH